jgi:lysyl-tRNA synthetase class II
MSNPIQSATSFSSVETQRELRITKMETLKNLGFDPYPVTSRRDITLLKAKSLFENPESIGENSQNITISGRLKTKRISGKIAFGIFEDESLPEGFQCIFKPDLPQENVTQLSFIQFKEPFDKGGYLHISRKLGYSCVGEKSIMVKALKFVYV